VPKRSYATCRICGRHRSEVGLLSHGRLCGDCGPILKDANNDQLHEKRGPAFALWRRRMAASVGAVLLDDVRNDA